MVVLLQENWSLAPTGPRRRRHTTTALLRPTPPPCRIAASDTRRQTRARSHPLPAAGSGPCRRVSSPSSATSSRWGSVTSAQLATRPLHRFASPHRASPGPGGAISTAVRAIGQASPPVRCPRDLHGEVRLAALGVHVCTRTSNRERARVGARDGRNIALREALVRADRPYGPSFTKTTAARQGAVVEPCTARQSHLPAHHSQAGGRGHGFAAALRVHSAPPIPPPPPPPSSWRCRFCTT